MYCNTKSTVQFSEEVQALGHSNWFLVHRPHPSLENVKFQKYTGKFPHQQFEKSRFQKQILGIHCIWFAISMLIFVFY